MGYKEPKPEYCLELQEIWSQFNDQIKWTSAGFKVGYVRLGGVNLARISFWEINHSGLTPTSKKYVGMNKKRADNEGYALYTGKEIADDLRYKTYYWGINFNIYNIATGNHVWREYQIDFGGESYLHKVDWTWHTEDGDPSDVDVPDMIKKVARGMLWVGAWCS